MDSRFTHTALYRKTMHKTFKAMNDCFTLNTLPIVFSKTRLENSVDHLTITSLEKFLNSGGDLFSRVGLVFLAPVVVRRLTLERFDKLTDECILAMRQWDRHCLLLKHLPTYVKLVPNEHLHSLP